MSQDALKEIKFGTDGWRAVIGDTYTFKNLGILSQAYSDWVNNNLKADAQGVKRVAVGYDTRFMSADFAQLVSCVLAQNGIEVILSDAAIPTPALSYGVTLTKSLSGIMITASHNPYKFNGFKIKTAEGGGAGKDITDKVEGYLGKNPVQKANFEKAKAEKKIILRDYKVDYLKFIKGYLDLKKMKNARFKVLTDAMHGSGNSLMAQVIKGTKINLTLMREDVNPWFEGKKPEPVVEFLGGILTRMKKEKFDLGLVLDGDADRIAAVAPGGEFIHPQKILGLLILHLVRNRGRTGGVVKTICGTTMIDNICKKLGLKLYETPVGFKYISDLMINEKIVAGGEEAGGMGFQDYIPERDGTLAGLLLAEMMVYQKKNIKKIVEDMEKEFGHYYYQRFDLKLEPGESFDLNIVRGIKEILGKKIVGMKDFDGVKLICEDDSWLMFRPSGTEPLVRAYSEAKSLAKAKQLIRYGAVDPEAAIRMIYWFAYYLLLVLSWIYFPIQVEGRSKFPRRGGFVLASNHESYLDPIIVGLAVGRPVCYFARNTLFKNGFISFIMHQVGAFPVKRDSADIGAIKEAVRRLKKGTPLLIFPEGTRFKESKDIHGGIGLIAAKSGVPIIPVYVDGSEKVLPPGAKFLKRSPVKVIVGVPREYPQGSYSNIAARIVEDIYSLHHPAS